jgi:hypothetical protein
MPVFKGTVKVIFICQHEWAIPEIYLNIILVVSVVSMYLDEVNI